MDLRHNALLGAEKADQNYYVDFHRFNSNSLVLEFFDIPETWDFIGYLWKEINISTNPQIGDWVMVEQVSMIPHGRQLINWSDQTTPYILKYRFVKYARSGEFKLWER